MFCVNGQPDPVFVPEKKHPSPDASGLACNGTLNMDSGRLGFVFICDTDGRISESTYDELRTGSRVMPGSYISAIFRPFCSREALKLVRKARPHRPIYDCELHVLGSSERDRVYCSAFAADSRVVVIGTRRPIAYSIPTELLRLVREKPELLAEPLEHVRSLYADAQISAKATPRPALDQRPRTRPSDLQSRIAAIDPAQIGPRWFLDLAAHDLRNPISGILAGSEYLMEDASQILQSHHLVVLTAIQSSARHALELIHDLHEISGISADELKLDLRPANLVSLIQHAAAARSYGKGTKIEVEINVKKEPGLVTVDAGQLSEALKALIDNTVGSSRPASAIEIVVGCRADQATILFRRKPSTAVPNPGANEKSKGARPKLSDVYAALLLARARKVVKVHGGSVRARARRNQGYSITVTLPICAPARQHFVAARAMAI